MNHEIAPQTAPPTEVLDRVPHDDGVLQYEETELRRPPAAVAVRNEALSPDVVAEPAAVNDNEKITLVVGGLADGVERNVIRETAQREFDISMAQGGGRLRRFARGIVKGNYLRELSLLRERRHAAADIAETGRLAGMSDDEWHHVTAESIQRVLDDDGSHELIDEHAGESREQLSGERGAEIKSLVNSMITGYVNGEISRDAIQEETRRRLADLARDSADAAELMGAGNVYMTNIADIAETVRSQMSHERGLQDILDRVEVISAKINTDVHGEARATKFEQILDKMPVNAAWVSTGLAVAYGVGVGFGKSLASKATRFGIVGAGSGVMSYFQEKSRLAHERAQVGREAAIGENVDGTERRQHLAETLYDMKDASLLSEAMRALQNDEGAYEVTDQSSFDALLAATLDASARMDVSATTKADHIRFSSRENIPAERRALMTERFRARSALRNYYESNIAQDPNFAEGEDFETFFDQSSAAMQEGLLENQSEQDSSYQKMSRRYAMRSALKGMIFGAVLGEVIQEGTAFVNTDVKGAFENSHESTETLLSAGWRLVAGQFDHAAPAHEVASTITSGYNQLDLGSGLSYDNGTLAGPDGLKVEGLSMGPQGFDDASIAKLHTAGVEYGDTVNHINEITHAPQTIDTGTYMQQHGQPVERSWFDNDTAAFDKNELRADMQVNDEGQYVISAGRMIQGDSYHDGQVGNVDYSHMKVLLSPTIETQATPLVLDMDAQGHVIIPKGSVAEQWFEKGSDGTPVYKGAYAEIAQSNGNGQYEMFATVEGRGDAIPSVTDQIEKTTSIEMHHTSLFYTPEAPDIEVPPVISVASREGLRRTGEGGASSDSSPDLPPSPDRSRLAIEQRPTRAAIERRTPADERQELRRALQMSSGRDTRMNVLRRSIEAGPRTGMRALTGREQEPSAGAQPPRNDQRQSQSENTAPERPETRPQATQPGRPASEESSRGGAEMTPHQLAEQHPDYTEAVANTERARRGNNKVAIKTARRQQTRTYRRLLGYYERLAEERQSGGQELDPNEEGINIHEKADRDPRYVALRRTADRIFKQEADLLRGRPERSLNDAERTRLVRLRDLRRRAEHGLDKLKSEILIELDDKAGGRDAAA